MCLKFIPRIVFVGAFFAEAIFYHHLELTFKCIPFLLIVIMEDIFPFVLEDFYDTFFPKLCSFVKERRDAHNVYNSNNLAYGNQYSAGA